MFDQQVPCRHSCLQTHADHMLANGKTPFGKQMCREPQILIVSAGGSVWNQPCSSGLLSFRCPARFPAAEEPHMLRSQSGCRPLPWKLWGWEDSLNWWEMGCRTSYSSCIGEGGQGKGCQCPSRLIWGWKGRRRFEGSPKAFHWLPWTQSCCPQCIVERHCPFFIQDGLSQVIYKAYRKMSLKLFWVGWILGWVRLQLGIWLGPQFPQL